MIVAHDLAIVWLTWVGLHLIRYGMPSSGPMPSGAGFWSTETTLVVLAQGLVFWQVGLYRGLWRFASTPDLWNILKAAVAGIVVITVALFVYNRLVGVPRSVLVLYPFVLAGLLGAPRLIYRAWKDAGEQRQLSATATRVLILGAGRAGEQLVRDLRRTSAYHPVGFLDDSPQLRGGKLHGIPVLGTINQAADIARKTAARLLIIAVPSLDATSMQRIITVCERSGLPFRMVPRLKDVLEGRALPGQLKEVDIDDLLGREPVVSDWRAIREWLGARSVLVTGAGGSIGSELCRQCARQGAKRITLLEFDELSLMRIHAELQRDFNSIELIQILGDCGDPAVARRALELSDADAVFHAAAYKQVPVLESQLREAIRNNALATQTMAAASAEAGASTFILISTDKAVDPVNVLGASKRLAEMLCQGFAESSRTHYITVRFGNVLDSAGSVVPLFRDQINSGGPVTVTDPQVTRYFMTIPEACLLILQAGAIGSHEAIYTLDMGSPVAIRQLAEQMIRLAGKQPGRDIAIVYTGLRPGEKLHETLFHSEEQYRMTAHPKILQGTARPVDAAMLEQRSAAIRKACEAYDLDTLIQLLRDTVPEFAPEAADGDADNAVVVKFPSRASRR
ncbi:putative nucleoside-diphosphate sugar epimerase [Lysobacter silvestris]|uniref:Putative nucleoside-diphosphate sugar epimerase n=2 Tax=Solilutibacter silvestris TaxID=1645665 RepID=A0A2K1PYL4_9GAMM|nr:putative nucleoside-diphosphate sugar epimerase [Lysobacter silvestris]